MNLNYDFRRYLLNILAFATSREIGLLYIWGYCPVFGLHCLLNNEHKDHIKTRHFYCLFTNWGNMYIIFRIASRLIARLQLELSNLKKILSMYVLNNCAAIYSEVCILKYSIYHFVRLQKSKPSLLIYTFFLFKVVFISQ